MGGGLGVAIVLGERDCSLQRHNQKIIEETPAPNVSESTRQTIRTAAENLASHLEYKSAGTMKFIYDERADNFYFFKINARLQVEYSIAEMVTGLDLVELMILIAANKCVDLRNIERNITGVSMKARLYAKNPLKDFRPSPNQLTYIEFPKWTRVDIWIEKGTVISAEYDPTLAKIIVHGKNKDDALNKLLLALQETKVYDCITNLEYLKSIVSSQMFRGTKIFTNILNAYTNNSTTLEIITPGIHTSIQDYSGRYEYWRVGVPPSGPMDSYSFRLANRIVGNEDSAATIEITLIGPIIKFHFDTIIDITSSSVKCTINGHTPIKQFEPIQVHRGNTLSIGKLTSSCRAYLAIKGDFDIPNYLRSKSTFTLGQFGGFNGRVFKASDIIFIKESTFIVNPISIPNPIIPQIPGNGLWLIGTMCGPHESPDIFTEESIDAFFNEEWKAHYNSNRFGVRLIGPKTK